MKYPKANIDAGLSVNPYDPALAKQTYLIRK
jgi:hypothetical protein